MINTKNYIETSNKTLKGVYVIKNGLVEFARQIVREYESIDDMNDDIENMSRQGFDVTKKIGYDINAYIVVYTTKNAK